MKAAPSPIADFLAQKRIAVFGVSRDGAQPANAIYRILRQDGHEVVAINPAAPAPTTVIKSKFSTGMGRCALGPSEFRYDRVR